MFWFENGWCLLNIAWRFSLITANSSLVYTYDVQAPGGRKLTNFDRILRLRVVDLKFTDERELHIVFENGDKLVVFDNPTMRSWWFYRYDGAQSLGRSAPVVWAADDAETEDDQFGYPL